MKDVICVNQEDLTDGSRVKITIVCDYCGQEFETNNKSWKSNKSKQILKKDSCCYNCRSQYTKESNILKYGKENVFQVDEFNEKKRRTILKKYGVEYISQSREIQEKIKNSNIEKYGVDHYTKTNEYKEYIGNIWKNKTKNEIEQVIKKREETCLTKYGVKNPKQDDEIKAKSRATNLAVYGFENVFQNKDIKQKIKEQNLLKYGVEYNSQREDVAKKISASWSNKSEDEIRIISDKRRDTCLAKYGVTSPMKKKEISEKAKITCLEKYGVDNPMKNPKIKKKLMDKLNENDIISTSKQQRYLHNVIGGVLNYYTWYNFLDIAFEKEKIYIEYDGGGHDLDVKLGSTTNEEFKRKEMKRYFALKKEGWKCIKIVSSKDKLPYDDVIIRMIKECKELLCNYNWVELNIEDKIIKTFDFQKEYNFGELRYIRKEVA